MCPAGRQWGCCKPVQLLAVAYVSVEVEVLLLRSRYRNEQTDQSDVPQNTLYTYIYIYTHTTTIKGAYQHCTGKHTGKLHALAQCRRVCSTVHGSLSGMKHAPFHASMLRPAS